MSSASSRSDCALVLRHLGRLADTDGTIRTIATNRLCVHLARGLFTDAVPFDSYTSRDLDAWLGEVAKVVRQTDDVKHRRIHDDISRLLSDPVPTLGAIESAADLFLNNAHRPELQVDFDRIGSSLVALLEASSGVSAEVIGVVRALHQRALSVCSSSGALAICARLHMAILNARLSTTAAMTRAVQGNPEFYGQHALAFADFRRQHRDPHWGPKPDRHSVIATMLSTSPADDDNVDGVARYLLHRYWDEGRVRPAMAAPALERLANSADDLEAIVGAIQSRRQHAWHFRLCRAGVVDAFGDVVGAECDRLLGAAMQTPALLVPTAIEQMLVPIDALCRRRTSRGTLLQTAITIVTDRVIEAILTTSSGRRRQGRCQWILEQFRTLSVGIMEFEDDADQRCTANEAVARLKMICDLIETKVTIGILPAIMTVKVPDHGRWVRLVTK